MTVHILRRGSATRLVKASPEPSLHDSFLSWPTTMKVIRFPWLLRSRSGLGVYSIHRPLSIRKYNILWFNEIALSWPCPKSPRVVVLGNRLEFLPKKSKKRRHRFTSAASIADLGPGLALHTGRAGRHAKASLSRAQMSPIPWSPNRMRGLLRGARILWDHEAWALRSRRR